MEFLCFFACVFCYLLFHIERVGLPTNPSSFPAPLALRFPAPTPLSEEQSVIGSGVSAGNTGIACTLLGVPKDWQIALGCLGGLGLPHCGYEANGYLVWDCLDSPIVVVFVRVPRETPITFQSCLGVHPSSPDCVTHIHIDQKLGI